MQIRRSGAHVIEETLPQIEAHPGQMQRLFQNLVGNALKIRRPNVPPRVKVYPGQTSPDRIQVIIEDNGIGLSDNQAEQIFQPFHRRVVHTEYEGTGIGLAICHKIIERHNWSILAHSIPGQGSTFVVTLPVKRRSN
jgi:signal transduction histidine kinase